MLKRKILIALLVGVIAIPSLFITAFAIETEVRSESVMPCLSTVTCSCYTTTSNGIQYHSGDFSTTCSYDYALMGTYSCQNVNYAKTSLTKCAHSGYKDTYVYERDSSGETKTSYKTASDSNYPAVASVNPTNTFKPVCVRHEVATPNTNNSSTGRLHARNYQ